MSFVIIVQFADRIMSFPLTANITHQEPGHEQLCETLCTPDLMIHRRLVRGYNDKVYFAEQDGQSVIIKEISTH